MQASQGMHTEIGRKLETCLQVERIRIHLKPMQAASPTGDESVAFDVLSVRWGSANEAGPASTFNSRLDRFQLSGSLLLIPRFHSDKKDCCSYIAIYRPYNDHGGSMKPVQVVEEISDGESILFT